MNLYLALELHTARSTHEKPSSIASMEPILSKGLIRLFSSRNSHCDLNHIDTHDRWRHGS